MSSRHVFNLYVLQMRKVRLREVRKYTQVSWLIRSKHRAIGSQFCLIPKLGIFPQHGAASKFLDSMLQKKKNKTKHSRWWGGWG